MVASTRDDLDQDRLDIREAYERGRRDERARRKRHPVAMTLMFLAAVVGVAILVLALTNGSFGSAGQVVDKNLNDAAQTAGPAMRDAAGQAGDAVRNAASNEHPAPTAPNR